MVNEDWTPRLSPDGVFYCSPRCGSGRYCRKEWHDHATQAAAALAAMMGPGWEPRVWENLGWHYKAMKGDHSISPHEDRRGGFLPGKGYPVTGYSAWISTPAMHQQCRVQFIESATHPHDALGFATQAARTAIARIEQSLAELSEGQ